MVAEATTTLRECYDRSGHRRDSARRLGILARVSVYSASALMLWALGLGVAVLRYGSVRGALTVLRGGPAVLEEATVSIGDVPANTKTPFTLRIRNLRSDDLRLVGSSTGCSCVVLASKSIAIPGRTVGALSATFDSTRRQGQIAEPLRFFVESRSGGVFELDALLVGSVAVAREAE